MNSYPLIRYTAPFPGSPSHKVLEIILGQSMLLKDIGRMSPQVQTSCLEAFHNVVCLFAPKSTHYFYNQMEARWVKIYCYTLI